MKFTIKCIVIDEGDSTSMMSLAYWEAINSLPLSQSMTILTTFDGNYFRPHVILPAFSVLLGGKTMEVEVEVVDAPLDYNLLLGRDWNYVMKTICTLRILVLMHQCEIRSPLLIIVSRQLRMFVSGCIPP
jgi:hypothetical protein